MPKAPDHPTATSRLPPPPAPVARDANPWPMPEGAGEVGRSARAPRLVRQSPPPAEPVHASRSGLSRFVPIAVFLAILGSVASGAFEALGRGDRLGAFVPLIIIGVAALSVWRRARRARRDRAPGTPGGISST